MVLPYGSTLKATQDHLIQWYWDEGRNMKVDGMSTHGFQECGLLASIIWATIQKEDFAASALRGMDYLRGIAKSAAADDVHLCWTTPSGFVACQNYVDQKSQIIKTSLGDGIRRHRLNVPTDQIDRRKSVSAFPANYIHSLDSSSLVETINLCLDEKGSAEMSFSFVHDSYGTHAADAPSLARLLRTAHTRTFGTDPLNLLHHEVLTCLSPSAKLPVAPKTGSWTLNELEKAQYFFT
jgi:DNA-directed RNA polymerase